MALQDVCGLHSPSLFPQWTAPFAHSFLLEESNHLVRRETRRGSFSTWMPGRGALNPLEFYMPVPEFLTESPINFGQTRASSNVLKINQPDNHRLPASTSFPVHIHTSPSVPLPFTLSHGTTTLGFVFKGGVIAAADTRSSCSGEIACPASPKVLPIHSHLVGTTSGTSADCALWKRILARELRLYQLRHRRRLSTGGAAKLLSHMLHPFKGTELCVAATLCGWDGDDPYDMQPIRESCINTSTNQISEVHSTNQTGTGQQAKSDRWGPRVVYVCSDGLRLAGELFSVGSGSPYAYSILDSGVHWEMTVEEAEAVAREAVFRATFRDAYSGNCVDLYQVSAQGWRRRVRENLKEEYYREREKGKLRMKESEEKRNVNKFDHETVSGQTPAEDI